jgi:hypothetical protein
LKKYHKKGLIILIAGLIMIGLWYGGICLVFGGFENYYFSSLGFGVGNLIYTGVALLLIGGIALAIVGPMYVIVATPRLSKKQKRGFIILIIGAIIILICLGITNYVLSTASVQFLSSYGMIQFIFFLGIGSILVVIGLVSVVASTLRKEK